ncbi:MAG: cell division protein FtsW [Mogibacterium sp.]|nr:cell division protein FtsW [Mogibacterium sp.]MBR2539586.1 cell division protein FtsW [Mogibacterium sp.]
MASSDSPRANRKRARQIKKARKAELRQVRLEGGELQGTVGLTLGEKLSLAFGGFDAVVLVVVVLFSLFGVAMVFSAGYYQTINISKPQPLYYLIRQLFFVVTGWLMMIGVANINYHFYTKISYPLLLLSIGMLVLVLLIGSSVNNAQRWISIFGIRITPSELSKLFMIIFTSAFLVEDPRNIRSFKGLLVLLVAMAAHFILIIRQPNLSTAIVIVMIMFAIMLVAGLNLFFILFPIAAGIGGYFYIVTFKTPYHWYQRLTSFIDPFADRQGDGYQVTQGLIALGNGGLKGLGFGQSIAKNMYLPEPQNDFILAILGEELGYIGFLILMAAYIFLLVRLLMIALDAADRLGFLLATGVAVMLGLQVIINVAVVTSTMPATGITLPFISYGGSSMWTFMLAMGIALNVSKVSRKLREAGKAEEQ